MPAGQRVRRTPRQPEQLLGQIHRSIPDLPEVAGTGQHREHHHRQHRPDPIPDATSVPRIGQPMEHVDQAAHPDRPRIR